MTTPARCASSRFGILAVRLGVALATLASTNLALANPTTFFWDPSQANPANGGSGNWDNVSMFWRTGTTGGPLSAWTPGVNNDSIATFAGTAGTVTLTDNISANRLNFTAGTSTTPYFIAASAGKTLAFVGNSPEIDYGSGTASTFAEITANVNATSQLRVIDTETTPGGTPVMNFDGAGNSFAGGIYIDAPTLSPLFNPVLDPLHPGNVPAAVMRVNFNSNTAAGVGVGAGDITIACNGIRFSNVNTVNSLVRNMTNNIILNPNNLPNFEIAMGGTNASAGGNQNELIFSGNISGSSDIIIGNDVTYKSGGAGVTVFGGTQKTYSGKTIMNMSNTASFQVGADNVLPANNVLQFGNIPALSTGTPSAVGAMDLNGHLLTVANVTTALTNNIGATASIVGITNTSSKMATLIINGSDSGTYAGPIGTAGNLVLLGPTNNNEALTRSGTGTTTIGAANVSSTYIGDTNVIDGSTLVAATSTALSPNSNYIVSGTLGVGTGIATLDLAGNNNTINSLSGNASGIVTTTAGSATLTIGSTASLNATPAPTTTFAGTLQDGLGGSTLSLTMGGKGVQILSSPNNYSGPTNINAGTLRITNSTGSATGSGAVNVNSGGALGGTGIASGTVTVNSSGTIAPGTTTAVGALTVGTLSLLGGGNFAWKITDANQASTPTSGPGVGYDTVGNPLGTLNLDSSLTSNPFTITLNSKGIVPANFSPTDPNQHWTLANFGSQTGSFSPAEFSVVANGFKGGNLFSTFNVSNPSPGLLQLNYVPGNAPPNLTWVGPSGSGGGSGSWDPSGGTSWNNGTNNTGWNSADGADFNVGSGTVTLSGAISAPVITFDVDGYTIAGSSPLSATAGFSALTVQVTNAGTTGTINAPINSSLTLIGAGKLVLGGSNTFGGTGTVTVGGTTTLQGSVSSLGGGAGSISTTSIDNDSTVIFDQIGTATYAGTMTGSGVLVKQDSGTLSLTGANSYRGGTVLSGGTLRIISDANLGAAGGSFTFNGGTLAMSGLGTARPIIVTAAAGSTLDDTGGSGSANVFSGGASFAAGAVLTKIGPNTLQITTNAWNGSGSIVINQGALLVGDTGDVNSNPSTFLGGNSLTLNNGTTLTIVASGSSAGSITPPSLTMNGNVTIALFKTGGLGSMSPTLNSSTTISGGTIRIAPSSISQNGLIQSTVTLGPTTFNGDTTIQTSAAGASGGSTGLTLGAVTDNGHTLNFLGQGNASQGFGPGSGVTINDVTPGTTPTQTGNWVIGDAAGINAQIVMLNTQHAAHPEFALTTGNIIVNSGSQLNIATLSTTAVYGPQSGMQTITLNGSGPLNPAPPNNPLGAVFVASRAQPIFNANVNVIFASPLLYNLDQSNATIATMTTFNGPVTGPGDLTLKAGDTQGRLIFAGPNNLTGATTITGGKLEVDAGSSMGTGDLTMAQSVDQKNTDLILNNVAQSVGNLRSLYSGSSSGPINQEIHLHGTILSITQTVDADYGISPADGTTPTPSDSVISGTGGIVLTTASTHELSLSDSNNTYSGPTAINGGSLAISTDTNLGTAPGVSTPSQLTVNGGQFHAVGGSPLMLAPTRGFTVGPNGGTLRTDAATPLTIQGVTTFSNAASTLTVSANSSVKFISTANATAVAVGSSVTVASGATLELAGTASALSDGANSVNVVNNSRATGGGLQATGTNQNVGFISGTGDTAVAAGSDLTADGIIQNSLTIGGSAGNFGLVTIRASSSVVMAGDPAGGADGLVVAGSLAPSAPFGSDVSGAALAGEVGGAAALGDFASPALGTASGGSAAVPEPATWLLALLAVAGLAAAGRFRREIGRGNRVAVGG